MSSHYVEYHLFEHQTKTQWRQITSRGKQTTLQYFEMSTVLEAECIVAHCNTLSYRDNSKYSYFPAVDMEHNEDEDFVSMLMLGVG